MNEKVEGQCFCCGAGPQLTAMAKSALPNDAMEHFKSARVEILKGIRHLIDARIQKLSSHKTHGATIPVD